MELNTEVKLLITSSHLDDAFTAVRSSVSLLKPSDNHVLDSLVER